MASEQARFVTGSTMGHVVRMTLTGSIGLTFMFLIDAANLFWVSSLGVESLVAALGFAWTIQFFAISLGIGLMIGATATVSKLIGQGKLDEARRQTVVSALVAVGMQAVFAAIIIYFRHEFLAVLGARGETAASAASYLLITLFSLPMMAVGMVGTALLRAKGDAYRSMMVTMVSGLISMVIDPVLIVWMDLGIEGAAVASVIARTLTAALAIYYLAYVHKMLTRITRQDFTRLARPFLIVAIPAILAQLSTPFGNYLLTKVVAEYGDSAVAGWAVVGRITVVAFGGIFSLSGAIGGIIGQNFGAGKMDRVRAVYRDSLIFCAVYVFLAWSLLAYLTPFTIAAFGIGGAGADVVAAFTTLAAGGFVFVGALFIANAVFNNLGRPIFSTLLNWTRDGLLIWPFALLMSGWLMAPGAIHGQALANIAVGSVATILATVFLRHLVQSSAADKPVRTA